MRCSEPLRREINEKNPGGKDLVMTFQELRRDEKTSTAKVTFVSGASVPSIMFIVRGFYDIARAPPAGRKAVAIGLISRSPRKIILISTARMKAFLATILV